MVEQEKKERTIEEVICICYCSGELERLLNHPLRLPPGVASHRYIFHGYRLPPSLELTYETGGVLTYQVAVAGGVIVPGLQEGGWAISRAAR